MEIPSNLKNIVDLIFSKSPLQKKKIMGFLLNKDASFLAEAEEFSIEYIDYLKDQDIPLSYAVDAYIKMCNDMVRSQISFMKTGKYPREEAGRAFDEVYNNDEEMKSYMIGLAMSQFLWPTHNEMYAFFKKNLNSYSDSISSYLEIGPGHGLFLRAAMKRLSNNNASIAVIDISQTSIITTKSIMEFFFREKSSEISYKNIDILNFDSSEKYDFVTMGEVLEHVNYPEKLLNKIRELLSEKGKAFISTCVDCPTIDHVYHFTSVDSIRNMFSKCGLTIVTDGVLPVENLEMEEIIKKKITINYCAIVMKKSHEEI